MALGFDAFMQGTHEARKANEASDAAQQQGLARLLQMKAQQEEQAQTAQMMPFKMDLLKAQVADAQAKPQDRIDARAATRETAMMRLTQAAQQFEQNYQARLRTVKTQEERLELDQNRAAFQQQLQSEAARFRGAEGAYNFGFMPGPAIAPTVGPAPTPAVPPAGAPGPASGLEALLAGRSPEERAAITAASGSAPVNISVPGRAGPVPTAMPAAAPAVPQGGLDALPSGAPVTPASMSMAQSGGTEGRFPPVGQAAVTPAPSPGMGAIPSSAVLPQAAPQAGPQAVPAGPGAVPAVGQPKKIWTTADAPADLTGREKAQWVRDRQNEQGRADAVAAKGAAKVELAGGRESTQLSRVISGGNHVSAALQNIVKLPIESSTGIVGNRGPSKGIMNAGLETMVQKMTTQDVQTYQILTTGLQRQLAAIEAFGNMPTNALMDQMKNVVWQEGWTNFSKLMALSEIRQIVEQGLEVVETNPRVAPEQKALVRKIVADVTKAVPWTNAELIALQQKQALNPNATLGDVVKAKQGAGEWRVVR